MPRRVFPAVVAALFASLIGAFVWSGAPLASALLVVVVPTVAVLFIMLIGCILP